MHVIIVKILNGILLSQSRIQALKGLYLQIYKNATVHYEYQSGVLNGENMVLVVYAFLFGNCNDTSFGI